MKRSESPLSIGIALGGGGAKGFAHIGILRVLEENGVACNLVSGTSMGALIGALYCLYGRIDEVEKLALEFENSDLRRYLAPKLSTSGLISEKRIRDFLKTVFREYKIENLKRPFFCTATDILSGEELVFSSGSLVEAVMSSISIPVVFPANHYHGRYLVDGGLVDPVPVGVLKQNGAAMTIAANVLSPSRMMKRGAKTARKQKRNPLLIERIDSFIVRSGNSRKKGGAPNIIEEMLFTFEIMQQEMVRSKLKNDAPDILIEVETSDFRIYEFNHPREIIDRGKETTRRLIKSVKRQLGLRS
jgi:NTE family protein